MKGLISDILHTLMQSEFWRGVVAFLGTLGLAGIGLMAKVADEVKSGDRRKFFSKALLLEVPVLLMMAVLAVAAASFYELAGPIAAGISTIFGYAGPKIVDTLFLRFFTRR